MIVSCTLPRAKNSLGDSLIGMPDTSLTGRINSLVRRSCVSGLLRRADSRLRQGVFASTNSLSPYSPTAEAWGLKPFQSEFESQCGYQVKGCVVQLAETCDLGSYQCGFESLRSYQIRGALTKAIGGSQLVKSGFGELFQQ